MQKSRAQNYVVMKFLRNVRASLGYDLDDETLGMLCEALLHFMLTASVLPSERKVYWKGVNLDIVVPSLKILSKSPDRAYCHPNHKNGG